MSFFTELTPYPPDALLKLIADYRDDPSPNKIDLGVGVYQDESGNTPIFSAVVEAQKVLAQSEKSKSYLGPLGWPGFDDQVRRLILGDELYASLGKRVAVVPTPGSSGALKIAGTLVKKIRPNGAVWMSAPTWANHQPIFASCGLQDKKYPYYDEISGDVCHEQMQDVWNEVPEDDFIVLHGCCHNPTGADLGADDWRVVTHNAVARGTLPLVDIAYHGLGEGFGDDMRNVRSLLGDVPEAILTYSFSKNMGLYRERVGALLVLAETEQAAQALQSHMSAIARHTYSMPPSYGAALASIVLERQALRSSWLSELEQMRERIVSIRYKLVDLLKDKFDSDQFNFISAQSGMFSLLPLSSHQISRLKAEHSIYLAPDGRMNLCGLSDKKIDQFVDALHTVLA